MVVELMVSGLSRNKCGLFGGVMTIGVSMAVSKGFGKVGVLFWSPWCMLE